VTHGAVSPALLAQIESIVGAKWIRRRPGELVAYDADALPGYHATPSIAVFPGTRDETIRLVKALADARVPFVPRGAGTGLSGGSLADGVVLLGLNRLTRIIEIDAENRLAHVEPGVVNAKLSRAVAPFGLHYAPDPSSQTVCTIGGNVAENAGGPHCLKYGVTLNHVAALDIVLPSGKPMRLGNPYGETEGYDLLGVFVGSEGCFGIATDVWVRLVPLPQAVRTLLADFPSVDAAARAVSRIIATGIVPAALELMDNATIRAVEASIYAAGYPVDAEAVLLCEVDGMLEGLHADVDTITDCCMVSGARTVRVAVTEDERTRLWQGRKKAFGAMGRIAPSLVVQDAVVPRTRLPEILAEIASIGARHGVKVCNVFHAGDGNLHPNIPYDASDPEESERVHAAMSEIMKACIAEGGTITGEHGVGLDKLPYMESLFDPSSLAMMCAVRTAFDPDRRANPGKVVPVHSCREWHGTRALRERSLAESAPVESAPVDNVPVGTAPVAFAPVDDGPRRLLQSPRSPQ
jgi:glycolate oxidase subunit GlcD